VVEAVDAIAAHHDGETLALVTHGGCIRGLLSHAENYSGDGFERFPHIGNTSISLISIDNGHWRSISVNDMAHLESQPEPELVSAPPDDAEPPQSL
jgi:probable phosphoglycerate mutase